MARNEFVTVDGSEMELLISEPEGDGPFPGLMIGMHNPAHASLIGDEFMVDLVDRFAANGYACVSPNPYHWWPAEQPISEKRTLLDDRQILADLAAGYQRLTSLDGVDANHLGITGYCFGGMMSWLGAVNNPNYKACTIFWGGGINAGRPEDAQPPIELAAQMPCPVMGFFGNDDQRPSPADVDEYAAALEGAGKEFTFHRYDGAGHAFQDFSRDRYRKEASDDAWEKVLAFFGQTLKGG